MSLFLFLDGSFILSSILAAISVVFRTTTLSFNISSISEAIATLYLISPFLLVLLNFALFFLTFRKRYSVPIQEIKAFSPKIRNILHAYCAFFQDKFNETLKVEEKQELVNLWVAILIGLCNKENPEEIISIEIVVKLKNSF